MLVEGILLLAGFLCLGWFGYMTVQRIVANSWQSYEFEQALAGEKPTIGGYLRYVATDGNENKRAVQAEVAKDEPAAPPPPPTPVPKRKLKRNELVGRIEIPRLKVNAVVKEGVDSRTLSRAVGHVPYTPLPGQPGNVGVAAHRDTHFRGLRNVRKGDTIRVKTLDGTYIYEVDKLKIVWPKNVEVLDPTPENRITLVTCYPFNYVGSAPKRFIVQGKQVGFEQLEARAKTRTEPDSSAQPAKAGS
jgi:sortase A